MKARKLITVELFASQILEFELKNPNYVFLSSTQKRNSNLYIVKYISYE